MSRWSQYTSVREVPGSFPVCNKDVYVVVCSIFVEIWRFWSKTYYLLWNLKFMLQYILFGILNILHNLWPIIRVSIYRHSIFKINIWNSPLYSVQVLSFIVVVDYAIKHNFKGTRLMYLYVFNPLTLPFNYTFAHTCTTCYKRCNLYFTYIAIMATGKSCDRTSFRDTISVLVLFIEHTNLAN